LSATNRRSSLMSCRIRLNAPLIAALLAGCASAKPAPETPGPSNTLEAFERLERTPPPATLRVRSSTNFELHHAASRVLVEALLREAERLRREQLRWWGRDPGPRWQPICRVYLYPTAREMRRAGRGRHMAAFAMARSARLTRGLMLQRQISLAQTDARLTRDQLPHEMSHVVLAELLSNRHPPLWANEGLATLRESARSRQRRRAWIARALRRRRTIALRALMESVRYPGAYRAKLTFYAESMSLVELLLQLGGRAQLLVFLRDISPPNYKRRDPRWATIVAALAQRYRLSPASLEARWRAHVSSYRRAQPSSNEGNSATTSR
jgi:hypothetical protein